jgi:hypothetical protein
MGMAAGFNDMNNNGHFVVDDKVLGAMDPANPHGILLDVGRKPVTLLHASTCSAQRAIRFLILRHVIVEARC